MNDEQLNLATVRKIMNDIQTCDASQFSRHLKVVIESMEKDNMFLQILNSILVYPKNTLPPKINLFLKKIFEDLSEDRIEILNAILLYLLDKLNCKAAKIRVHCLGLINYILKLKKTPHNTIFDAIQLVNEKLFDKDSIVRKEALKICLNYQNVLLSENLSVQTTLKDGIRFDSCSEIRKIGLNSLDINASTMNCILERAGDSNLGVRKVFWASVFPKLDLFGLESCKITYLLKIAFSERELNLKPQILNVFIDFGFLKAIDVIYSDETLILDKLIEYYISFDGTFDLKSIINGNNNGSKNHDKDDYDYLLSFKPSFLHFLNVFFNMKEEHHGRDNLGLLPIEDFLLILYRKCNELEAMTDLEEQGFIECKKSILYLFRLLIFYDIFTENDKKMILSLIGNLILKSKIVEVVEECIILSKRICDKNLVNFLGSIIKRTKNTPICFLICEYIFKHFPENNIYNISEMKNAIITEVAMINYNQSSGIFYWHLIKGADNLDIERLYLGFLPNIKIFHGAVDLIILGRIKEYGVIEEYLRKQVGNFYSNPEAQHNLEKVVPSMCKLLLAMKIENIEYVKFIMVLFYTTKSESIQQYLSLFFFEFFKLHSDFLIEAFCSVLEMINTNQRILVDQTIYWLNNAIEINENAHQKLFYNVVLRLLNAYENLDNRKYYMMILEILQKRLQTFTDKILNKKIICLLSYIIKKKFKENFNLLLTKILEIDDGSPLDPAIFDEIKLQIN